MGSTGGGGGGGVFGPNGQKLHETYKISIFESKQWEAWDEGGNFSGSVGIPPFPPH